MNGPAEQLFNAYGARKYACAAERRRFIRAASRAPADRRALCLLLAYSGCRISEALAVTSAQLDSELNQVVLRTLKRRRLIYRAVPLPKSLMAELEVLSAGLGPGDRLWSCCRQTGWRWVKQVMREAAVTGLPAMPKGLRHGFGIANVENNVPATLTQRWMGHARSETTAIYQQAVGPEERSFAERLWAD